MNFVKQKTGDLSGPTGKSPQRSLTQAQLSALSSVLPQLSPLWIRESLLDSTLILTRPILGSESLSGTVTSEI